MGAGRRRRTTLVHTGRIGGSARAQSVRAESAAAASSPARGPRHCHGEHAYKLTKLHVHNCQPGCLDRTTVLSWLTITMLATRSGGSTGSPSAFRALACGARSHSSSPWAFLRTCQSQGVPVATVETSPAARFDCVHRRTSDRSHLARRLGPIRSPLDHEPELFAPE